MPIMSKQELEKLELRAMSMSFPQLYEAHKRVLESSSQINDISTDEKFQLCTLHMRVTIALENNFSRATS